MFGGLFSKRGDANTRSYTDTQSYLDGAYRPHKPEDVGAFTQLARDAFPEFAERINCFGADWLGRQFATDSTRIADGKALVLMLEPGTGEALEIPVNMTEFHKSELAEQPDAVAAVSFYQEWLAAGGQAPNYNQCIGYKQPLFLNGADDIANLEVCDFDVYWTVSAQLLARVRELPAGASIGSVSISD